MFILDTTALIALVSELTYDSSSATYLSLTKQKLLQSQIIIEQSNPGELLIFLTQFNSFNTYESSFLTAENIIQSIGGSKEQSRWESLKNSIKIMKNDEILESRVIITANKKLKKTINADFIYHTPRSLLGV